MNDTTDNRRAFHRIFFEAPVTVIINDTPHKVHLIDISLDGALISNSGQLPCEIGDKVQLEIELGDSQHLIAMDASISHIENDHVGLQREQIDMESISHLRRLVELNLGDSEMLHRDMEHLIHQPSVD
ncbi:MAG: PilZ domain-containing protein [Gammaproteobacteria bacterium]|nr:PilZ domain-containing protein [Gammaproteobacteria bacterium]